MGIAKRPARSDGEATRARILESAGELIGSRGYADTTSKAIAAEAGVDLASINYHFGSRDGLYRGVLIEAHRRFVRLKALQDIANGTASADEKLRELLRLILNNVGSVQHWSTRVLMRELLAPTVHFAVLEREELLPNLDVALGIVSEMTGIPVGDQLLLTSLLSSVAPCLILTLPGAAMIAKDSPSPSPDELLDYVHSFAAAGLRSVRERYRADNPRERKG